MAIVHLYLGRTQFHLEGEGLGNCFSVLLGEIEKCFLMRGMRDDYFEELMVQRTKTDYNPR